MKMMKAHRSRFRGYVIAFLQELAEWQRRYGRIKELGRRTIVSYPSIIFASSELSLAVLACN